MRYDDPNSILPILTPLQYVDAKSGETLSIYSPHDESLVADNIHVAGQVDVDAAVSAARAAFKGEWSTFTGVQRTKVMLKFADLIEKNASELASWEAKAMGMPIQVATMISNMAAGTIRCTSTPLVLTFNSKNNRLCWMD